MSPTQRTGLIAFAVAGGLFLFIGIGVGALVLAQGDGKGKVAANPRADKEGVEWTLNDLTSHLDRSGITTKRQFGDTDRDGVIYLELATGEGVMAIWQYKDVRTAKDLAGADSRPNLSWGRFRFVFPSTQYGERVRTALGL